jgi:hypothetical protein
MKLRELIRYLQEFSDRYGDLEVDVALEDVCHGRVTQFEKPLYDLAVDAKNGRVKLLSEGI